MTTATATAKTTATSDVEALARQLADEFRGRAGEYDRTGEFPHDNYARMRETGYLRALVPADLGGLGATLPEMARAQQALARGCASTALAVNMHQLTVGSIADAFRNGQPVEPVLRRVADEGIVFCSSGAEAFVSGPWQSSTKATPCEGGYRVSGTRFFSSQAPGAALIRITATDTATNELLVMTVPMSAEGVKIVETWDTTGMRATASHDVVIDNVFVPDAAVGLRLPDGEPSRAAPFANLGRWFLTLASSVYLGIAEEARDEALRSLGSGINSNFRAQPLTDAMIGEMEADLLTARAVRDAVIAELATPTPDPSRSLIQGTLCREIVMTKAIAVVEKATQIAGGRSYYRRSPLERLSRDVRAGRFHPPAAPVSFQLAGERTREAFQAEKS